MPQPDRRSWQLSDSVEVTRRHPRRIWPFVPKLRGYVTSGLFAAVTWSTEHGRVLQSLRDQCGKPRFAGDLAPPTTLIQTAPAGANARSLSRYGVVRPWLLATAAACR